MFVNEYDFENNILQLKNKFEKAKRCIRVEKEYASDYLPKYSIQAFRILYENRLIAKKVAKNLNHCYKDFKEKTKTFCKKCFNFDNSDKKLADALIWYINCCECLKDNIDTIDIFLDAIAQMEPKGSREGIDLMESVLNLIEKFLLNLLAQKQLVDEASSLIKEVLPTNLEDGIK